MLVVQQKRNIVKPLSCVVDRRAGGSLTQSSKSSLRHLLVQATMVNKDVVTIKEAIQFLFEASTAFIFK